MISVAIIASSKSAVLTDCLKSARQVSDDVVMLTNDDHDFKNYADQKNTAVSKCKNDWVLSLDADEVISQPLVEELKDLDFSKNSYVIPRKNIIFGRVIKHTNWDPNGVLRLFKKSEGRFVGDVHEQWQTSGAIGMLKNPIIHHNYQTVEQFLDKANRYSTLETTITNPFYDFARRYFWHRGFLDGWHGLFLSYLQAIYHIEVWIKKHYQK
jgi:hypothetical protein